MKTTKHVLISGWLSEFADTITKTSSSIDLTSELSQWNNHFSQAYSEAELPRLRRILGEIYQRQTQITNIIKMGFMRPSRIPELATQAQQLLPDIEYGTYLDDIIDYTSRLLSDKLPELYWYTFTLIESPLLKLIISVKVTPKTLVFALDVEDLELTKMSLL